MSTGPKAGMAMSFSSVMFTSGMDPEPYTSELAELAGWDKCKITRLSTLRVNPTYCIGQANHVPQHGFSTDQFSCRRPMAR